MRYKNGMLPTSKIKLYKTFSPGPKLQNCIHLKIINSSCLSIGIRSFFTPWCAVQHRKRNLRRVKNSINRHLQGWAGNGVFFFRAQKYSQKSFLAAWTGKKACFFIYKKLGAVNVAVNLDIRLNMDYFILLVCTFTGIFFLIGWIFKPQFVHEYGKYLARNPGSFNWDHFIVIISSLCIRPPAKQYFLEEWIISNRRIVFFK